MFDNSIMSLKWNILWNKRNSFAKSCIVHSRLLNYGVQLMRSVSNYRNLKKQVWCHDTNTLNQHFHCVLLTSSCLFIIKLAYSNSPKKLSVHLQIHFEQSNTENYTVRDNGRRERDKVSQQAFTLVIKCQKVDFYFLAFFVEAAFDTQ